MISRMHIWALCVIAIASLAVFLGVKGESVSSVWLTSLGFSVAVVSASVALFDWYFWRLRFFQGWFVHRPNLVGAWHATIRSLYEEDGERVAPIEAEVLVKQSHSSIHMTVETKESTGRLVTGEIIRGADGSYEFVGIYNNVPRLEIKQAGSQTHDGAFRLQIRGNPSSPSKILGTYWTDRGTAGEMELKRTRDTSG